MLPPVIKSVATHKADPTSAIPAPTAQGVLQGHTLQIAKTADLEKILQTLKPLLILLAPQSSEEQNEALLKTLCGKVTQFVCGTEKEMRYSKQETKIPFTFHLFKRDSGNLKLTFTLPTTIPKAKTISTTYKIVKKGFKVEIPAIKSTAIPDVKTQPVVILRVHKEKEVPGRQRKPDEVILQGGQKHVLEGLYNIKILMNKIGEKASERLVAFPEIRQKYKSQHGEFRQELEMDWYNGDLLDLCTYGTVPLEMMRDSKAKIKLRDKLRVVIDSAKTLQSFHDQGYVHRDIKPDNILLRVHKDPVGGFQVERKIGDFDFTRKFGRSFPDEYVFWSPLAASGQVAPDCDVFGLIMCLCECMFPDFHTHLEKKQEQIKRCYL